jgi:sigma-54 dependent transcriptional regulator, acetoin dehydrogenase operon transcriptional activator AcoR
VSLGAPVDDGSTPPMTDPDRPEILPETAVILDSITDGVFTVDLDFTITFFNRAAERIIGVPREEAIGRPCCDILHASICESACALRETIESGSAVQLRPIYIIRPDGRRVSLSMSAAQLCDSHGKVIGGVETFRDLSAIEDLRRELTGSNRFHGILSKSPRMHRLFEILPNVASSESTVMIEGASGSGKELLAQAIHELSPRAGGPMVTVNCGALPDTLLESEFFGHVRGAFTGATTDREGRFARAEGGTIFLDEIGDVSPALQVRLLRVLQERTYEPIGSSRPVKANVRVITATNKNLRDEIRGGRFREDLYYRLNVVRLEIPALADRREDVLLLAEHFIERFNRLWDRQVGMLSDAAISALLRYPWPGNVRELENAIEHAFILSSGPAILPRHLPSEIVDHGDQGGPKIDPMGRTLADLEVQIILAALDRNRWRRLETAQELGIDKTTLWRKMKRHEIQDPTRDPD